MQVSDHHEVIPQPNFKGTPAPIAPERRTPLGQPLDAPWPNFFGEAWLPPLAGWYQVVSAIRRSPGVVPLTKYDQAPRNMLLPRKMVLLSSSFRLQFILCLGLLAGRASGQPPADPTPQVKYLRPSVTTAVVASSDPRAKVVINAFKDLPMIAKFDDHGVGLPELSLPPVPASTDETDMASRKARAAQDSVRRVLLNKELVPVARKVVAKWWNRDASGAMDLGLVGSRGAYSATDQDVTEQKSTQVGRIDDIGSLLSG